MPNHTTVVITLRKTVADEAAGTIIIDAVKARLADRPDIEINAHITTRIEEVPE